jgi:hypothetical protein
MCFDICIFSENEVAGSGASFRSVGDLHEMIHKKDLMLWRTYGIRREEQ